MSGMATPAAITKDDLALLASKTDLPTPSTQVPPAVSESGAVGTDPLLYALANHTHPSKVRKAQLTTAVNGLATWVYKDASGNDAPFATGVVPIVLAVAQTAQGNTDLVNVQVDGAPTNIQASFRVNRNVVYAAAVLGINILQVPTSIGATIIHAIALAP